ncbi:hypothetical protein F5Y16DRAFT_403094 [Xylariaceae sp. FL0255]|nr:hypothetical protein F5Y16DRAFT_403094 [Xylariaceae sp. FL0255]
MLFMNTLTPLFALMLASGVQATYEIAVFSDSNCQNPIASQSTTKVLSGTCDSNIKGGCSSAKVLHKWASPAGTITFYENSVCSGMPSRTVTNPGYGDCISFGFNANAVYLIG